MALSYAARGWHVFPAPVGTKRSHKSAAHSAGRPWGATSDLTEIAADFARWPHANVGIVTGPGSGLLVIDVDTPEDHLHDGMGELARLIKEHGPLPETVEAATPTGGRHLYFNYPHSERIQNSEGRIGPGIDVRAEGGIVLAPPSCKPDGRAYTWTHPPGSVELADCPEWLLALARKPERNVDAPPPPRSDPLPPWAEAAIDGVLAGLRKAPEGQRNDTLNKAAFRLGQIAGAGLIGEAHAIPHLRATAQAIGLDRGEIDATIRSGWAAGLANPRGPEDRRAATSDTRGERIDPETGEVIEDPEPVDFWANHGAPELPEGLLPAPIETFARSHAETMGVDPAGLAMACLAVCGAAITDEIALQVKQHDPTWRESARLWVGLVGSPSMKKTPIISAAVRPLKNIDSSLMRAYREKQHAYDELLPKERKGVPRPQQERRIISDATIEAAQEVLKDSPRGVLSLQDELSGWFGAMDKYAPGKGSQADRGFWLQAYNGGTYSLNRVTRGSCYIPNCSVSLLGGVQPEPIRAIASDTYDDGLVQRLIPVVLRPGRRGRDVPDDGTLEAYERLIQRLERLQDGAGPLRFDEGARGIRESLEAEHLELIASLEVVSPKMAAHFGKHDGLFARLCVIWHCVENCASVWVPNTISTQTAARVAEFMKNFIRPSAVAFYTGLLGMSAGHDRLLDLAAWILAAEIDEVKARDVQRSGQTFRHVSADEVRLLCEKLEAFGWGSWADAGPKSSKARFIVNPRVHSLFAERGAAEAERRAKARDLIRQTIGG
ncbi:MAG: DUF3987 domain-containing protein [Erythrobacteraceae bacterium]|nr:DUF3987 domain-containing protein [Erythrobacteraceae bacterium]